MRTAEYFTDAFRVDHVISFDAIDDGILKRDYSGEYSGVIRPKLVWTTAPVDIPTSTLSVLDKLCVLAPSISLSSINYCNSLNQYNDYSD